MVALWAFDTKGDGLLNVHQNEDVYEVEIVNENWTRIRNQAGKVGIVPTTYLRLWDHTNQKYKYVAPKIMCLSRGNTWNYINIYS